MDLNESDPYGDTPDGEAQELTCPICGKVLDERDPYPIHMADVHGQIVDSARPPDRGTGRPITATDATDEKSLRRLVLDATDRVRSLDKAHQRTVKSAEETLGHLTSVTGRKVASYKSVVLSERHLATRGGSGSIIGANATVTTSGALTPDARGGKPHDTRKLFLNVQGPGVTAVVSCSPKDEGKVRHFAATINTTAAKAALDEPERPRRIEDAKSALVEAQAEPTGLIAARAELTRVEQVATTHGIDPVAIRKQRTLRRAAVALVTVLVVVTGVVIAALAAGGGSSSDSAWGSDSAASAPNVASAEVYGSLTANNPTTVEGWLEKLRADTASPGAIVGARLVGSNYIIISTTFSSDRASQGEGAQMCFDLRRLGWTGTIEILNNFGGMLARTVNTPGAGVVCKGHDF